MEPGAVPVRTAPGIPPERRRDMDVLAIDVERLHLDKKTRREIRRAQRIIQALDGLVADYKKLRGKAFARLPDCNEPDSISPRG